MLLAAGAGDFHDLGDELVLGCTIVACLLFLEPQHLFREKQCGKKLGSLATCEMTDDVCPNIVLYPAWTSISGPVTLIAE